MSKKGYSIKNNNGYFRPKNYKPAGEHTSKLLLKMKCHKKQIFTLLDTLKIKHQIIEYEDGAFDILFDRYQDALEISNFFYKLDICNKNLNQNDLVEIITDLTIKEQNNIED